MVPPADQQSNRPGPQPYVPPVPPPPHRPATPNRRRGVIIAMALGGVLVLVLIMLLMNALMNWSNPPLFGDDDRGSQGEASSQEQPSDPEPDEDAADSEGSSDSPSTGPPDDMAGASADRMVRYHVHEVTCGLPQHNIRSRLQTNAEYCVVMLGLSNVSDELVVFDHNEQMLTTSFNETVGAEEPSRPEYEKPLWDTSGIGPGATVEGELVFILRNGETPRTLVLSHHPGAEPTEIDIQHMVD